MQYIRKNNIATFTFELENCDGSPMDLSEKTLKLIIKKNKEQSDSLAIYLGEITQPDTNIVAFEIPSSQTGYELGNYIIGLKIFYTDEENVERNNEVWSDELQVIQGVFND